MYTIDVIKEKELLDKAKSNKSEFSAIYEYFINDVYRFVYSILNNQHDAEDITSQTFVELYKKLDSFVWQDLSIKYWLFRTARYLSYKTFKDHKMVKFDNDIDNFIQEEVEISFVDQIVNLELVELVKQEIHELKPNEREIINLRIWEGMGFKDISGILEIKENTIKKTFYRSIEKLKKSLESKGVKSLIALPFLFTAVKQVGATPTYAATGGLVSGVGTGTIKFNQNVITKSFAGVQKAFITKVAIGSIAVAITASTVGGALYIKNSKNNKNENNSVTNTSPLTTVTPNISITNTPRVTTSPNAIESGYKKYQDDYVEFDYPKDWSVNVVSGQLNNSQVSIPYDGVGIIELSSNDNKYSYKLSPFLGLADRNLPTYLYDFNKPYELVSNSTITKSEEKTDVLTTLPVRKDLEKYNITAMYFPDLDLTLFSKTDRDIVDNEFRSSRLLVGLFNTIGDINGNLPKEYGGKVFEGKCEAESVQEFNKCTDVLERFFDTALRKK